MTQLDILLKDRGYSVFIEPGILFSLDRFINLNRKVMVVTDDGVPEAYVSAVREQCPQCYVETVKQGEGAKSFTVLEHICSSLLSKQFHRGDLLIAVGGGVVGDLAGFAASIYMRGIDFVNVPTTSLSQIDSSIGGKTAINLDGVKNSIGTFHQPKAVFVDSQTLKTLSLRHLNNGLVEALKAGLIADASLFQIFLEKNPHEHLDEIIALSLRVKKRVVELDEREEGLRKTLNFGHTIGHGIESVYGLSGLLHGESVAAGMLPMIGDPLLREQVRQILKEKLSIDPDISYDSDRVFERMQQDKKSSAGSITIVKVASPGQAILEEIDFEKLKGYLHT